MKKRAIAVIAALVLMVTMMGQFTLAVHAEGEPFPEETTTPEIQTEENTESGTEEVQTIEDTDPATTEESQTIEPLADERQAPRLPLPRRKPLQRRAWPVVTL